MQSRGEGFKLPIYFMNKGIIKPKIRPTDWSVSGESGITYKEVLPSGDWTPYLPKHETQYGTYVATQACTIFSLLNCIEVQLRQQGEDINLSDRFLAKTSGNTVKGNQMTTVADTIRKLGDVLEQDWSFDRSREAKMDWDKFYSEIPLDLLNTCKWLINKYDIRYEWVNLGQCNPNLEAIKKELKQAPLQVALSVGELCRTEHAVMIYKITDRIYTFDSDSETGLKDYPLTHPIPWILKIVIAPKTLTDVNYTITPLTKNLYFGQSDKEVITLKKGLIKWGYIKTPINLTAFYGNITAEAVKQFQRDYKVGTLSILGLNNGKFFVNGSRKAFNNKLLNG